MHDKISKNNIEDMFEIIEQVNTPKDATSSYKVDSAWHINKDRMPCPTPDTPANAKDITDTVKPIADSVQYLQDNKLTKTARAADSAKLNGKTEAALNVNTAKSATTAGTAANATKLNGKAEAQLSVSHAKTATTATTAASATMANDSKLLNKKTEAALNVNHAKTADTAGNSTLLNGKTESQLNVMYAMSSKVSSDSNKLNGYASTDRPNKFTIARRTDKGDINANKFYSINESPFVVKSPHGLGDLAVGIISNNDQFANGQEHHANSSLYVVSLDAKTKWSNQCNELASAGCAAGDNRPANLVPVTLGNGRFIWKDISTLGHGVPTRMICFQFATDPKNVKGAHYINVPTTGKATYTPTAGTVAVHVVGVGGGAGFGGGGFEIYVKNPITTAITIGKHGHTNTPASSSSFGAYGTADGGKAGSGSCGAGAIISEGHIGFTGYGGGSNAGSGMDHYSGGCGLGFSAMQATDKGIFPGGAGSHNHGGHDGANGIVWVLEYGATALSYNEVQKFHNDNQQKLQPNVIDKKKYANVLSRDNDGTVCITEVIDYNPKDFYVDGVFIECPNYVDINSLYIDGEFTTPSPEHRELYDYDWDKREWVKDVDKYKNYLKQELINEYTPTIDKLKSSLAAAFALTDEESLAQIKATYKAVDDEYKQKMKDIDKGKLEEKDVYFNNTIFCPMCGKLLSINKKGKKYCEFCGWIEK